MRLIDADELIKKFRRSETNTENENHMCLVARRMIKEEPTAYDVDKVVEQLQKISDEAEDEISVCEKEDCLYYDGFSDGVDKAIEIVKGGVVYGKL